MDEVTDILASLKDKYPEAVEEFCNEFEYASQEKVDKRVEEMKAEHLNKVNSTKIELEKDGTRLYFVDGVLGVSEYSHDLGEFAEAATKELYEKMKVYYEEA